MADSKPAEFFYKLSECKDFNGDSKFPLLSKLGPALLTCYNSSSAAETDFSVLNSIVADKCRGNTSQQRLEDRMRVKSNIFQCRLDCTRCKDKEEEEFIQEDGEGEKKKTRVKHCHCSVWKPSEKLVDNGQYEGWSAFTKIQIKNSTLQRKERKLRLRDYKMQWMTKLSRTEERRT